jgi:hypothetical protein
MFNIGVEVEFKFTENDEWIPGKIIGFSSVNTMNQNIGLASIETKEPVRGMFYHNIEVDWAVANGFIRMTLKGPKMEIGSFEYYVEKFEKNKIDPQHDPRDLLQFQLSEITSDENLDEKALGYRTKNLVKAYEATQ